MKVCSRVKIIFILLLFYNKILVSQDSLSILTSPKLNIHNKFTKKEITIKWPLKNFEYRAPYDIYYENNLIPEELFKKIIEVEPILIKKQNLGTANKNINYNKRLKNVSLYSGLPLLTTGPLVSMDGLLGHYGNKEFILRESIAGSTFLVGIICEVVAIIFNNKYKKSIKKAVLILND
ncbi:MAG: hypothetical protein ABIP51_07525 [Bacteroidia bacterium]